MLSYDTEFFEDIIYFAQELSPGHPVFMLHGYENDRLVVKLESGNISQRMVALNSKFIGAVDPNAKAKPLTVHEVNQLRLWTQTWAGDQDSGAAAVANVINDPGVWTKMKTFKLVGLDKAAIKRGLGDKTDVRLIAATLTAPGGLEKLGEIVAVDLFNGNSDRFSVKGGQQFNGSALKCLQNVGNVFVAVDGQARSIIGLDSFESASAYKDHDDTLDNQEFGEVWPGRFLAPDQGGARTQFAGIIVDDLNTVLGPRSRKNIFGRRKRLEKNAATRVKTGMESGTAKLIQKLQKMQMKVALSLGLAQRLTIIQGV